MEQPAFRQQVTAMMAEHSPVVEAKVRAAVTGGCDDFVVIACPSVGEPTVAWTPREVFVKGDHGLFANESGQRVLELLSEYAGLNHFWVVAIAADAMHFCVWKGIYFRRCGIVGQA